MNHSKINALIEQQELRGSLKAELELSLDARVERYLQVKPHPIIPYTYFSVASTEVAQLFRDGHYYGCIPLAQAVAEAIVKFMCSKRGWSPAKSYEKNIGTLIKRRVIDGSLRVKLLKLWTNRDDYHHLNPSVERDRKELEALARSKALLLREVEAELFGYAVERGKLTPKHPEYWPAAVGGQIEAYLRIE